MVVRVEEVMVKAWINKPVHQHFESQRYVINLPLCASPVHLSPISIPYHARCTSASAVRPTSRLSTARRVYKKGMFRPVPRLIRRIASNRTFADNLRSQASTLVHSASFEQQSRGVAAWRTLRAQVAAKEAKCSRLASRIQALQAELAQSRCD